VTGWPNGMGERAPVPCGQTMAKSTVATATAADTVKKTRSDIGAAIAGAEARVT